MNTTDPTADLTDDDVRRVCDEADRTIGWINPHRHAGQDRGHVRELLEGGRFGRKWSDAAQSAVARLRAERAKKGTP